MADESNELRVEVRNVGGIDERAVTVPPGATGLVGENATNRTSFLRAVALALGVDGATLKRDADAGEVVLEYGDRTCRRRLSRGDDGTVRVEGDALAGCDAGDVAPYAVLLADNEIRRTVAAGGDPERLYDLLMAPVDRAAIDRRVAELTERRQELQARLDEVEEAAGELAAAREERADLATELAGLRRRAAELERRQAALRGEGDDDGRVAALEAHRDDLQARLESLAERRRGVRRQLETTREELADLDAPDRDEEELQAALRDAEREQADLVERRDGLDARIARLEPLAAAHAQLADAGFDLDDLVRDADLDPAALPAGPLLDPPGVADGGADVTARLLGDEETRCGVCGSAVEDDAVAAAGEQLRALQDALEERRAAVDDDLEAARDRQRDLRDRLETLQRTESRRQRLADDVDRLETDLEELDAERERVETELSAVEADLQDARTAAAEANEDELVETVQALSEVESERAATERELDAVEERVADLEATVAERESVAADLEDVEAALADQRERIERIERDLVASFNDRMATLLDRLSYDNIARVWLELRRSDADDGGDAALAVHVAREADDGTVYDDSLDTLSESERAVVGLAVALTGYVVHDVAETLPVVLLDSVEMIDGARLDALLSEVREAPEHLLAAVLPGHARELGDDVSELSW